MSNQSPTDDPADELLRRLREFTADVRAAKQRPLKPTTSSLSDMLVPGAGLLEYRSKKPKDAKDPDESEDNDFCADASGDEAEDPDHGVTVDPADRNEEEKEKEQDTELDEGELMISINGRKTSALDWLDGLKDHNEGLTNVVNPPRCAKLRPEIVPDDHQYKALASINYNMQSRFKGICIGHPPGPGRTLVALMAIVEAIPTADCPSVVVAPGSLIPQWRQEVDKYFEPGTIKCFTLNNSGTSIMELLEYDVIFTSYDFMMSEWRKAVKFVRAIEVLNQADQYDESDLPKRPDLSILSDRFANSGRKFPYLVLDEAHIVKNADGLTYHAIQWLRDVSDGCIMLTNSPVDQSWEGVHALTTLLKSQPFDDIDIMKHLFTERDPFHETRRQLPDGEDLERLYAFLTAWIVRRPEEILALDPLKQDEVECESSDEEIAASDRESEELEASEPRPKRRRVD